MLHRAAVEHFADVRERGRGTSWFRHLDPENTAADRVESYDELDRLAAAQITSRIKAKSWGREVRDQLKNAKHGLAQKKFKPFEARLVTLGALAGASESFGNNDEQAAPDAVWIFGDLLWVAWEAKSEAKPGGKVSARYAREATSHLAFTSTKREQGVPEASFTCFVTPQTSADAGARAVVADNVFMLPIHGPGTFLSRLEKVWTTARSMGDGLEELTVLRAMAQEACLPSQWIAQYTKHPLKHALAAEASADAAVDAAEAEADMPNRGDFTASGEPVKGTHEKTADPGSRLEPEDANTEQISVQGSID